MTEFLWPVRVYYEDTDSGGVVYYANYLKFMERARTELFRAQGFEQDQLLAQSGVLFVVRKVEMDLLKPARFNDALEVKTTIKTFARTNIIFNQTIHQSAAESTPLASAQIQIVCIDAERWKPTAIPPSIISALNEAGEQA